MNLPFRTLDEARVSGKRVLARVDLNVPVENGAIADATRIDRVLPTIRELTSKGAKVVLLSHFGRPKGAPDEKNSLKPIAGALAKRLGKPVAFAPDCIGTQAAQAVAKLRDGDVLLLENTRFHKGEEGNDRGFAKELAKLGDLYVNDAFSAAHRAHASTEGIAHELPAFAGRAMQAELEALEAALGSPKRPVVAIVGGAKISTKLDLLGNLSKKVERIVVGGAMANTFLAAQGKPVGKSLCETDLLETARAVVREARSSGCEIVLPIDVVVARQFAAHAPHRTASVDDVAPEEMILDIGAQSAARAGAMLGEAATLVWNGPLGAFELPPFDAGTIALAVRAAELTAAGALTSIAGGGDTLSALNHAGVADRFTYLSTAGGAFLEWLEGKSLPGVEALRRSA
ncbi:MAG TPA: phosphoglycerate kinase [Beijerinckiaceae bacterium]|nr:phosphoglycerate kinase [Beijerinckiaceae bacterium]